MSFALDVLTDTLQSMRDADLLTEDDFADCDWEEDDCPSCGRKLDKHTAALLTRCAR